MCGEFRLPNQHVRPEDAEGRGGMYALETCTYYPTNNALLNKLPTEFRRRNFVDKHRLSVQIGAKRAKSCIQCVCIPTELPFCIPPLVVGCPFSSMDFFSREAFL